MRLSWNFQSLLLKKKRATPQNRNKGSIVANIVMFIIHIGPVKSPFFFLQHF